MKKKKEKEIVPQYITSRLNTQLLNYKTYVMSPKEKILTFVIALIAGGVLGLIFYSGQFRDEDGVRTAMTTIFDIIIFFVAGIFTAIMAMPIRAISLRNKRKARLTKEFRSLLDALAVSLSSGMNMSDALQSAYKDLTIEFNDGAYILAEVKEMIDGLQNNIPIEEMMRSLGERSEINEIKNFANVFEVSYRAGGNMKDIVRRTNEIIGEKIEISEEIETALSSNKTQFNAMMIVPVVIVLAMRLMSSQFASSFATFPGVIAITVAIGMFFLAYKVGTKIMDIKG